MTPQQIESLILRWSQQTGLRVHVSWSQDQTLRLYSSLSNGHPILTVPASSAGTLANLLLATAQSAERIPS